MNWNGQVMCAWQLISSILHIHLPQYHLDQASQTEGPMRSHVLSWGPQLQSWPLNDPISILCAVHRCACKGLHFAHAGRGEHGCHAWFRRHKANVKYILRFVLYSILIVLWYFFLKALFADFIFQYETAIKMGQNASKCVQNQEWARNRHSLMYFLSISQHSWLYKQGSCVKDLLESISWSTELS